VGAALPNDITRLLKAVNDGEKDAWEQLLAVIYEELRRLAGRQARRERRGHTLPRTALVNEAYLRLMGVKDAHWESRAHFFSAAAEAMRRILVEYARYHGAEKRGGGAERVSLDERGSLELSAADRADSHLKVDLQALDEALHKLEADERHKEKANIVKLRYFAGLSVEETAQALGISAATVKRDWAFAKAWLYREMTKDEKP
jgi:RNA polymerase sigma factor (TIGR02999 family)